MEYRTLGKTGICVSRLCFGTLTIGPLQANLPLREGADLLIAAIDLGVNFFDTADLYGTYPYIREALRHRDASRLVIASKSYDYTREGQKASTAFRKQAGIILTFSFARAGVPPTPADTARPWSICLKPKKRACPGCRFFLPHRGGSSCRVYYAGN